MLSSTRDVNLYFDIMSKVYWQSSNLFGCVISLPKLVNHMFESSNLFICVFLVPKLLNIRLGPQPCLAVSS